MMKTRQRLVTAALTALTALACPALHAAEPKRGGTLTIGLAQDPAIIDPIRTGTFTERQLSVPVYEPLFDVDIKGNVVPLLAESYSVSDDSKTWRIKLRPGIKFHDGTPLDAQAVVVNLERYRNPANRCRCLQSLAEVKDVKAIDALTVDFVLNVPNAALATVLADAGGIMVSPAALKADPTGIGNKPVGTGPFKFVEWQRNSNIVFAKNPDYWRPGRPYLDKLVFRGYQNVETREVAYTSGQTDIILQSSFRFVASAQRDKKNQIYAPLGFGTEGVYMNLKKAPLDDLRIRRAVAHAINRDLLIKTLGFGVPTPAYSMLGRGMPIKQPEATYPKYDLAKAKALVAEYGKPVAFSLQYNNTPETRFLVQSLQDMWAAAGIKVDLQPLDQNRLVQNMSSKEFTASIYRYTGRPDPHANLYTFLHSKYAEVNPSSNYGGIANKRVDELLDQGMATIDPTKRRAIYGELLTLVSTDVMPHAYLYNVTDFIVTKKYVKDLPLVPDGLVRFADMWRD